jgi:DNA-directed RNA polymerase subunit M/transcription elongation factor TFIIS
LYPKNEKKRVFVMMKMIKSSLEYEKKGFEKYYESLSIKEKERLFPEGPPKMISTSLWESPYFEAFQERYSKKIRDLQEEEVREGGEKCTRCGSTKTRIIRMQTRSGDEGVTFFVQCTNCGFQRKVNS